MNKNLKKFTLVLGALTVVTAGISVALISIPSKEKPIERGKEDIIIEDNKNDLSHVQGLPEINDITKDLNKNRNADKKDIKLKRETSKKIINSDQKVKYVAFGDSIAAGFIGNSDKDEPGKLVKNSNNQMIVEGFSMPAYLAEFFLKTNKLQSFENYAVSSSTIEDWNLLFKAYEDENKLNIDELAKIKLRFGEKEYKNKITRMINDLQEANLVTLTLGANDFLHTGFEQASLIPFDSIFSQIKDKKLDLQAIFSVINNAFSSILERMQIQQEQLIKYMKKYAVNANINFIGYPLPLAGVFNMIDNLINKNSNELNFSLGANIIDILNKKISAIALKHKVFYIETYDHAFWNKNISTLTPNLFDIHPGLFGYKKMAMDIFAKLISQSWSQEEYKDLNFEFSNDYRQKDQFNYLTEVNYGKDPEAILKELYKNDAKKYLFEYDLRQQKLQPRLNENNYIKRVLDQWGVSDLIFGSLLDNVFASDLYKKIDPSKKLEHFFDKNNKANRKELKKWWDNTGISSNLIYDAQKYLFTYDWDQDGKPGAEKYDIKMFFEALKTKVSEPKRIIGWIKSLSETTVFKDQKDEFVAILSEIFQKLTTIEIDGGLIDQLIETIYSEPIAKFISKKDLKILIGKLVNSATLKSAIGDITINLINNIDKYAKAKDFKELWEIFIQDKKNTDIINKTLKALKIELLNDEQIKEIAGRILVKVKENYPKYFKNIGDNELKSLVSDILNMALLIDEKYLFTDTLVNKIIVGLKNTPLDKFSLTSIFVETGKEIKNKLLTQLEPEQLAYDLIRIFAQGVSVNNKDTVKQMLVNIFENIDKHALAESIISTLELTDNKYLTVKEQKSLINKIVTDDVFNDLLVHIIDDLYSVDKQKLLSAGDLFEQIKVIFGQITNSKTYENIKPVIGKLISYDEISIALARLFVINQESGFNIDPEKILRLTYKVVENENFKFIVQNIFDKSIFADGSSFELFKHPVEILKKWAKDANNNKEVAQHIGLLAKEILGDDDFIDLTSNLVVDILNKKASKLLEGINKDDFKVLIKDFIKGSSDFVNDLNFIENFSQKFLDSVGSKNDQSIDFAALSKELFDELKGYIFEQDDHKSILKFFKYVAKNNVLSHKDLIKKFIQNYFDTVQLDDKNIDKFVQRIFANVEVNDDNREIIKQAKPFVKKALLNKNLTKIFSELLDDFLDFNVEDLQKCESIYDFLYLTLGHFSQFKSISTLKEFVQSLAKEKETVDFIFAIIDKTNNKIINKKTLSKLLKSVDNWDKLINLFANFIEKGVFASKEVFEDLTDKNKLISQWLQNGNDKYVADQFLILFNDLMQNKELRETVIEIVVSLIGDKSIFKGIPSKELTKFFNDNTPILIDIENKYHLLEKTLPIALKKIADEGYDKFVPSKIFGEVEQILSNALKGENLEQTLVSLMKNLLKQNVQNGDTIAKIVANGIKIVVNDSSFIKIRASRIIETLPDKYKNNNLDSKLAHFIQFVLSHQNITEITEEGIKSVLSIEQNALADVKTFNDLASIIYKQTSKNKKLINPINEVVISALRDKGTQEFLSRLLFIAFENKIPLDENDILTYISNVSNIDSLHYLIKQFITNVIFSDNASFDEFNDSDNILSKWLTSSDESIETETKNNLKSLLHSIIGNKNIRGTIGKNLATIAKSKLNWLKDIENEKIAKLIAKILEVASRINDQYLISDKFIDKFYDEIKNNTKVTEIQYFTLFTDLIGDLINANEDDKIQTKIKRCIQLISQFKLDKDEIETLVEILHASLGDNDIKNSIINLLVDKAHPQHENEDNKKIRKDFKEFIDAVLNSNNFRQIAKILLVQLLSSDYSINENDDILEQLRNLFNKDSSNQLIENANNLISELSQKAYVIDILEKFVLDKDSLKQYEISSQQIQKIIQKISENDKFKAIAKNIVEFILLNKEIKFSDLTDVNTFVKKWLKSNNNELFDQVSDLISDLLKVDELTEMIGKVIYTELDKSQLFTDEKDKQSIKKIILSLTKNFDKLPQGTILSLIKSFANELQNNDEINITSVISKGIRAIVTDLSNEAEFIRLIKWILNIPELAQEKDTIKNLVIKGFVQVAKKINLGSKIYSSLDEKNKEIFKKYLSEEELNNELQNILSGTHIQSFIVDSIDVFFNNADQLKNVDSLSQLAKKMVELNTNKEKIVDSLEKAFGEIFSNEKIKKLVIGLIADNIKIYGVSLTDEEISKMVDSAVAELPDLLKKLEIIKKLVEKTPEIIGDFKTMKEVFDSATKVIIQLFDLQNYNIVKVILDSKTLTENHETIKKVIDQIITKATSEDELSLKFAKDFGIYKLFGNSTLTDDEKNNIIKVALKSQNLKDLILLTFDEIFKNRQEYQKLDTWEDALNSFFNKGNFEEIKEKLKGWLTDISKQKEVTKAIGNIIAQQLKNSGFEIQDQDINEIEEFFESLTNALFNTDIIKDAVNAAFNELKKIKIHTIEKLVPSAIEAFINSVKSFVMNGNKFSISKLTDGRLNKIFDKMNLKSFSNMINILFKRSPLDRNKGVYKIIYSKDATNAGIDLGESWTKIFQGIETFGDAFRPIVEPLAKAFYEDLLKEPLYSSFSELQSKSTTYQSLWRVYTFLLMVINNNTSLLPFWTSFTTKTIEGMVAYAFEKAFENVASQNKDLFDKLTKKYEGNLNLIGLDKNKKVIPYYMAGMEIYNNKNSRETYFSPFDSYKHYKKGYGSDHVLVYIYYADKDDYLYNKGKKLGQVLDEALKKGYLPSKN